MTFPPAPTARGIGLTRLRDPIEQAFGRFGRFVFRHAWRTIAIVLVGVGALCTQAPKITFDTSTEGFLPPDDPVRVGFDRFREIFGRDQAVLVAVEADDLFDPEFLEKLRSLHTAIEDEVPNLQDVTSLINVRNTRGEGDRLIVDDLFEEWPTTDAERAKIRSLARSDPLYVDQLISRDAGMTTIVAKPNVYSSAGQDFDAIAGFDSPSPSADAAPPFLTGEENSEIVAAVEAIADRYDGEGFRILIAGVPVMVDRIMRAMVQDMARFTALSLVVIAICLALLFRRAAAVVLPITVSGLAMLSTVGVMAMIGLPISTTTQITPSFLLAVGVGSAVHILAIFYQATARGEDKETAVAFAMEHSGLAVVMTGLTTAGGLLSFVSAGISPIVDLGVITPVGIMASLVFSLVLLPALIAVFPMKPTSSVSGDRESPTRRMLVACGDFATTHAWPMVGAWALLLLVCLLGATRLTLSHDPAHWFAKDDPLRIAMDELDLRLNGTMFVELVLDTGVENGVQSPEFLNRMEDARAYAASVRDGDLSVGKTLSIGDIVKETHQALNENQAEFYAIPQDRRLLAQELLLFENSGSDDLEDVVDSQFRKTRFTLKMPFVDAIHYARILGLLERRFGEIFGDTATVEITGETWMMSYLVSIIAVTLLKTYALAFVIITPLMILLLGSLRMGLLSMIPNIAPIVVTLGLMGWLGIPLEIFTILIGSIALGLAVDDTIHFMHNFRRYFERSGDTRHATRMTLGTTGQAMLFTSIVLSGGFFIYTFASMRNLYHFGLLTGITILVAFVADLLLAPALMALYARRLRTAQAIPGASEAETA